MNDYIVYKGDFEMKMIGVERIMEYIDTVEPEERLNDEQQHDALAALPADWPQRGDVEFQGVSAKYRPELPDVLKRVSYNVRGGEKVGIVGRTGSGKSSIQNLLLRVMEPTSGRILIDSVDIATLPLEKLRQSLAIIPQHPVVFESKSIREQLDPGQSYTDNELFAALQAV